MSFTMNLEKAQQDGYVLGLATSNGPVARREIDDLMKNDEDCFNLFILALRNVMKDGSKTGYFQIAGIHGMPLTDWDGVKIPGLNVRGSYCTHASYLFPSWHRPYLAMMEQTLYAECQKVAGQFNTQRYKEAANRFRLPYWDWIKPRARRTTQFPGVGRDRGRRVSYPYNYDLPLCLVAEHLMVFDVDNDQKLVAIDNPLLTYLFPQTGGLSNADFNRLDAGDQEQDNQGRAVQARTHVSRKRTVRNPTFPNSEKDNLRDVSQTLNMIREGSVEQALDLIAKYTKYLDFAAETPRWRRDGNGRVLRDRQGLPIVDGPKGSLEDIHNTYHGVCGGDGHMGRVPVAAFDPIFWLHHCNIDRMLSVWQATHDGVPDNYLPKDNRIYGQDVPLWPFRKGPGKTDARDMWTSAQAQNVTTFGYTYKDLQGNKDQVAARWDSSYRWSLQSNGQTNPPPWMEPVDVRGAQSLKFQALAAGVPLSNMITMALTLEAHIPRAEALKLPEFSDQAAASSAPLPDEKVPEVQLLLEAAPAEAKPVVQWYLDTQVQRDALDGAFTIFYFLGMPEDMQTADQQPAHYSTAPVMAGFTKIFTAPREACDACNLNAEAGLVVTGSTPITPMLRDWVGAGELPGLSAEDVVPFIKKHLYWRVVGANENVQDPGNIPGLKVELSSTLAAQVPNSGEPANWAEHNYPEATQAHVSGNPDAH